MILLNKFIVLNVECWLDPNPCYKNTTPIIKSVNSTSYMLYIINRNYEKFETYRNKKIWIDYQEFWKATRISRLEIDVYHNYYRADYKLYNYHDESLLNKEEFEKKLKKTDTALVIIWRTPYTQKIL